MDNVDKWIKAGAYAVGTGSSLTKGAKTGDFAAVTAKAQEFVAAEMCIRDRYRMVFGISLLVLRAFKKSAICALGA